MNYRNGNISEIIENTCSCLKKDLLCAQTDHIGRTFLNFTNENQDFISIVRVRRIWDVCLQVLGVGESQSGDGLPRGYLPWNPCQLYISGIAEG